MPAINQYPQLKAADGSDNVNFTQAGSNAATRSVQNKLRDTVSVKDFGAVGNGIADDTAALKKALESGFIVDGGGLTYAINGSCSPTSLVGFQNASLMQIGNNTAQNFNTLNIVGLSNFFIDNVFINMGSNVTTLHADDGNNGLYVGGAAYNNEARNFRISRVTVTGNGCGTGIHVRHAERFTVTNCLVRDRISGSNPDPTNDSQNGIEIKNAANFVLSNCNVYNLKTRLGGVDQYKWTRGILLVEIRDSTITGCNVTAVDQAFDFSGGYESEYNFIGNRRWTISGCTANSANTWGFKFANVAREGLVTGCIANNIGLGGFVFSPAASAATPEQYNTQNIDVVGCKVVNVLGNSWVNPGQAEGFRVAKGSYYQSYPRSIRMYSCSVVDTQTSPTTTLGFGSDVSIVQYPATGYDQSIGNFAISCFVSSNITTKFSGIGPNICTTTGSSTQSIPNSTWTKINWTDDFVDYQGIHNTGNNSDTFYIKTPGLYRLFARVNFTGNATGSRLLSIYKNNAVLDRTTSIAPADAGANAITSNTEIVTFLNSGDYVDFRVFQNSGGALNVNTNESFAMVQKIDG